MEITITKTKVNEAKSLLEIQKKAFQADLEKYQDYDSSPATEKIERLIRKINMVHHYTIFINGMIVGGIDVRELSNNHYRLNRIFLDPDFQSKGLGSQIMQLIEEKYQNATKWSLDTPKENIKNHHFYQKFGYKIVGEHQITDKLTLLDFEKQL
ncbi:GNAT family N-acetyltransferase (plasmid) [Bacillus mycoides]|uniref:GNAT family N-acetyltransferase n=1 Tax=Bacillus mycoides TaxID=1405 RepID=UPI003F7509F8